MNRGNSLIAGVVLIGILGSLSIALQATTPTTKSVAQVSVVPSSQVAAAATETEPAKMACLVGYQYFSWTEKKTGDVRIDCQQVDPCIDGKSPGVDSEVASAKKAGATDKCLAAIKSGTGPEGTDMMQKCEKMAAGKCNLSHCYENKDGKLGKCVYLENQTKEGSDLFAPKHNPEFALKQLATKIQGGDQQAATWYNELKTQPGFQGAFDSAYKQQVADRDSAYAANDSAAANLVACEATLANGTGEGLGCGHAERDAQEAYKKLKDEQDRLDAMNKMKERLGAQQAGEGRSVCSGGVCKDVAPPCTGSGCRDATREPPAGPGNPGNPGNRPSSSGFGNPNNNPFNNPYNNNPYQQCYPQYYCMNNALYWGSQNQQQQYNQYNYGGYGQQQCQNQFVQNCQYGCQGNACAQNPQSGTGQTSQTQPTATLSCGSDSELFDVGAKVPLSFSCANSTSSTGSGFSTDGTLSGSASTTIQKPPPGADIVSYGLTCTGSTGQTASKRCDVKINVTSIVMVANPKQVVKNATSTIGWVTKGMTDCIIWSPDAEEGSDLEEFNDENSENTNVSGIAVTPALVEDTEFVLSCRTKGGLDKDVVVKVRVNED